MLVEEGMADFFERAVRDLDPAVHAIVGRAEQRGRRLRARRRAWMVLGSGLAVAVLAATTLAAGMPPAHPRGAPAAAGELRNHASTTHAGTSHASPKPSARSSHARPPGRPPASAPGRGYPAVGFQNLAPGYEMTTAQMLRVLRSLLPAGSSLSNVNPYSSTGDGTLEVDYNDGQGAVDLIVDVQPTAMFAQPLACPKPLWTDEGQRPAGALPISCAMRTLPDGSIERDAVMYADAYGFYGYGIYDQRPDGVTVFIQVANGINHTLPQVDRAQPPGSMAKWEAVAENPAWHLKKGWHLNN
ncbi:MAG TPA: hypothetical protein VH307_18535 [Streptosporangiaceae bacterium]|jgi:hypothetical protein|nr:hypothetical protein [Streptosporangiaceae bacterium]